MSFSSLVAEKKILVCCGSGGVGKTTVSASFALAGAMAGRKVLVCTIDPARRLADSLGLEALGNKETRIPDETLEKAGIAPKGELWGMMLDSKRTFDELIHRIAPSEEAAARVLENAFYQNVTTALAGSQEFSAMEKLYELSTEQHWDLIVLDTPPTRHALDFLDAPGKMTAFLDARVIQWFVKPYLAAGKMGFKFINRGAQMVFKLLERATGYQTLADLADFFLMFEGMYDGFRARAQRVRDLLACPETAFVLVTSPQSPSLLEARGFLERLSAEGIPLGGVVFNRVVLPPTDMTSAEAAELGEKAAKKLPDHADAVRILVNNLRLFILLAQADRRSMDRFLSDAGQRVVSATIPFFATDIHDLAGLAELAGYLE
ncbi:MAG: ArsA family ATPase [Deltaproteobacteria bacterium]|nr:ArsA family ATPase [Deltaproteobacteria bacterium]